MNALYTSNANEGNWHRNGFTEEQKKPSQAVFVLQYLTLRQPILQHNREKCICKVHVGRFSQYNYASEITVPVLTQIQYIQSGTSCVLCKTSLFEMKHGCLKRNEISRKE